MKGDRCLIKFACCFMEHLVVFSPRVRVINSGNFFQTLLSHENCILKLKYTEKVVF